LVIVGSSLFQNCNENDSKSYYNPQKRICQEIFAFFFLFEKKYAIIIKKRGGGSRDSDLYGGAEESARSANAFRAHYAERGSEA
jgi:hypothetical protein